MGTQRLRRPPPPLKSGAAGRARLFQAFLGLVPTENSSGKLHHNKIKVSVARELCAFIWELGTRIEAKQKATAQN